MRTKVLTATLAAALSLTVIPTISAANSSHGFTISIGKSGHHGLRGSHNAHQRKHVRQKHKSNFSRFAPANSRQQSAPRIKHHSPGPFATFKFLGIIKH